MQVILHFSQDGTVRTPLRDPVTTGLIRNWKTLLEHEVLLPLLTPETEAHSVVSCLTGVPLPPVTEAGHSALLWGKCPSRQQGLKAQLRLLAPKVLIICVPICAGPDAGRHAAQALHKILGEVELHIHLALKRPDHHLETLLGYWLLEGRTLTPFPKELSKLIESPHVDYRQIYAPWLILFPDAKLHLTRQIKQADPTAALATFTQRFELSDLPPLLNPQRTTPPRATWDSLRHANRLPSATPELHDQLARTFASMSLPADAEIELFGGQARTDLHSAFTPVAKALDEQLESGSFLSDLDDILTPRPMPLNRLNQQLIAQLPRFRFGRNTAGLRAVRRSLARAKREK